MRSIWTGFWSESAVWFITVFSWGMINTYAKEVTTSPFSVSLVFVECSKYKHCKIILWNYTLSIHLPHSCHLCYGKDHKSVPCLLSLPVAPFLWLPYSHILSTFFSSMPWLCVWFYKDLSLFVVLLPDFHLLCPSNAAFSSLLVMLDNPTSSVLLSIFKLQLTCYFADKFRKG